MVTMKVKAPHREACRQVLLGDARGSASDEPGCLRFDVLQDGMDTHTFSLYEVYRDEPVFEAHRQVPHSVQWRETAKDWFDGAPAVKRRVTVFPNDSAWEAVKPRL